VLIRHANSASDAEACAAIYAPYVTDTVISLEVTPPTPVELAHRIDRISQTHPWLVAEDAGRLIGYAYASPHRERASYRWATDVAVYVDARDHRRGAGGAR
jgi:L-amino acid N-acyltransferase YncA